MSIGLYMDHHVKSAVTDGLRRRGVDVLTCHEDDTEQATDEQILARATELEGAVFTQDDDFLPNCETESNSYRTVGKFNRRKGRRSR